ncbi:LPXTG cell wall anchor domain-containing protein [Isoptericola sp. F-RaC21]|uniref:LPXTG cell wall anchor domain-containing protein n=1 Tax=Isoptericola sp. F-RaC21 TaxID=3141452 RepID=UPI00315BB8AA
MRHASVAATAAALLLISAGPAAAGGSDDEPPYEVTADGLTLPAGETFHSASHVNVKFTLPGEDTVHENNLHVETTGSGNWADLDGKSFVPWGAFGAVPAKRADVNLSDLDSFCITWVQVEGYDEHFGEGEQEPVCTSTTEPAPEPSESPESSEPPVTETPSTPDGAPAPETSSPATPPREDVTEGPAAPGPATETADAGSGGDTQPAPADEPVTARPEAAVTSGDALPAVDAEAPEQAVALAEGDVDQATPVADELPQTGAAVVWTAVAAAALLAAGAVLLLVRRRRRA